MNRFCSMFSQVLKLFPRTEFQALVKRTRAERHARGFACWDQFVAMLFCQLGRAHSLREITDHSEAHVESPLLGRSLVKEKPPADVLTPIPRS